MTSRAHDGAREADTKRGGHARAPDVTTTHRREPDAVAHPAVARTPLPGWMAYASPDSERVPDSLALRLGARAGAEPGL